MRDPRIGDPTGNGLGNLKMRRSDSPTHRAYAFDPPYHTYLGHQDGDALRRSHRELRFRRSQKLLGEPLDIIAALAVSIILRIARSATPLSWCTCGGHVV